MSWIFWWEMVDSGTFGLASSPEVRKFLCYNRRFFVNEICRVILSTTSFQQKNPTRMSWIFWWEMVDSNHRRRCQQIYSLSPLATREISHMELVNGVEPSTCWLQISCSAIEPHQHIQLNSAYFHSPHSLYKSMPEGFKHRNVWYYITCKLFCQ